MGRSTHLVLVAALAPIVALASSARAGTFTVQPPFDIQSSVNAALASADTSDTIKVKPGTYNEMVTIDFSGTSQAALTIIGTGGTRPVIKKGVIIHRARAVTLENLKVESTLSDGIAAVAISDSRRIGVKLCQGKVGDDFGVSAIDSFEVVVDRCIFSGMVEDTGTGFGGYGISIVGRCAHVVKNCVTESNEHDGVLIIADRTRVIGTRSSGNGDNGISINGHVNSVKSCDCIENTRNGISAVGVNELRLNLCSMNKRAGIRWGAGSGDTFTGGAIRSNSIEENVITGILMQDGQDGCDVYANTLSGNSDAGIRVLTDHHRIRGNSITATTAGGGGGNGISIESAADDNCIDGNFFKNNAGDGIRVAGDRNYLVKNDAGGNDGFIEVSGADENDGRSNTTVTGTNDFP